ncbi:unnamed protein product [Ixodes pacificus]
MPSVPGGVWAAALPAGGGGGAGGGDLREGEPVLGQPPRPELLRGEGRVQPSQEVLPRHPGSPGEQVQARLAHLKSHRRHQKAASSASFCPPDAKGCGRHYGSQRSSCTPALVRMNTHSYRQRNNVVQALLFLHLAFFASSSSRKTQRHLLCFHPDVLQIVECRSQY